MLAKQKCGAYGLLVCPPRAPTYPHYWSQDSDPQMPGQSLETAVPGPGLSRSLAVPQLTCHNHQLCDNLVIIEG